MKTPMAKSNFAFPISQTFDLTKGHVGLSQTYGSDMGRFVNSYMEFVLTADGWIRVKWDVPASEVLKRMTMTFEFTKNQMDITARSVDRLVEQMRKWYAPAT